MEKEMIITVVAPIDCTDEQFQEWAEYSLGYIGGISIDNPLHDEPFEASDVNLY